MRPPMLVFGEQCDCPMCQCLRTLWPDTVAVIAERYSLDDAEATLHVQTYAPTLPRMTQ